MKDNNITDRSTLSLDQIANMEASVKEAITPADPAEIITNTEMFRVGNTYVKRDTDGKLRNIFTNEIVEPTGELTNVPLSVSREIMTDYTRIRDDLLTPMSDVQSQSISTIRSARRLSDIAAKNPEVLNPVGGGAAFLGRLANMSDTLNNYANQQMTPDQVVNEVMKDQLKGTASAQALFDAEILKYAYLYASVNLGQSGRGLSDNDFKQALRQVKASDGKLETFEGLLRQLTNETIGKVRGSIENIFGSEETGKGMNAEVASLERTSGQPIGNYPRNMDEFVKFNRLDAEMAWLNGTPSTGPIVEGGGNGGGNQGQTDFYGDGVTLDGIPENAKIKSNQAAKTLIERTDYEDTILINTLMGRDPKLSRAQATLILKEARGQ